MKAGLKREADSDTSLRCLGWEGYAAGDLPSAFLRASGVSITGEDHLSDDAASRRILAERGSWDIININTPFVRDVLHAAGAVRPLNSRFSERVSNLRPPFGRFEAAVRDRENQLIGLPQRCGPFNLVVNQNGVSVATARDEGFRLAMEPSLKGRFGILAYEDFNVMHIAIAAGLNPFVPMDDEATSAFRRAAGTILQAARLITGDHLRMNAALVSREIDFYISGGTYTVSPARLAGHLDVRAVTPRSGPIEGKGGVAFVEVNAHLKDGRASLAVVETFLGFLLSDQGAKAASLAAGACNPVVQMGDPAVRDLFTRSQLKAMQWDDLEEDLSYCADYAVIPDYAKLLEIVRSLAPKAS
jgi:spermidine/putrescine transport system substrate-binding protein